MFSYTRDASLPRKGGQGLVEYALLLVLVAIVVIAVVSLLGGQIGQVFSNIVGALSFYNPRVICNMQTLGPGEVDMEAVVSARRGTIR